MRTFFGESNVPTQPETVKIFDDSGLEQSLSFSMAFRTVWRQTFDKYGSMVRLFMLDPLTDWCLTPQERRVRRNQNTLKEFLREKREKHAEWRKKNPIAGDEPILMCDLLLADGKRFESDDAVLEHFCAAFFGFSQTTASSVC
mmetsp:Transcript_25095/g.31447  ORF Transcript_25095/g.31447 Transcript_25095/m.31447 type:complete len:143 (-) Transcript_25095:686-1114(-)